MINEISRCKENISSVRPIAEKNFFEEKNFDDSFKSFIISGQGGGFYYQRALIIYGTNLYPLEEANEKFKVNYSEKLVEDQICFGCDIFGNQFSYNKEGYFFFNAESAEKEKIAGDFAQWQKVIAEDYEYFTGINVLLNWESKNGQLLYNQRLAPKMPFVLGGEYETSNLYAKDFGELIQFNSSIAKQIFGVPDGTKFNIKIDQKPVD